MVHFAFIAWLGFILKNGALHVYKIIVGSGSQARTVPLVCVNTNGFARFPHRDA